MLPYAQAVQQGTAAETNALEALLQDLLGPDASAENVAAAARDALENGLDAAAERLLAAERRTQADDTDAAATEQLVDALAGFFPAVSLDELAQAVSLTTADASDLASGRRRMLECVAQLEAFGLVDAADAAYFRDASVRQLKMLFPTLSLAQVSSTLHFDCHGNYDATLVTLSRHVAGLGDPLDDSQEPPDDEWTVVRDRARRTTPDDRQDAANESIAALNVRIDECREKAREIRGRGVAEFCRAAQVWSSSDLTRRSAAWYYNIHGQEITAGAQRWDREAAQLILQRNRLWHADSPVRVLDLHCLKVAEGIAALRDETDDWLRRDLPRRQTLHVICGRGLHSESGRVRLLPAVLTFLNRAALCFEHDPQRNAGLVIVTGRRPR